MRGRTIAALTNSPPHPDPLPKGRGKLSKRPRAVQFRRSQIHMTETNDKPVFQLRYTLTRDDIAAFEFLPRELSGWQKLWLFGPILVLGAAAGYFEAQLSTVLPWDPHTKWGQLATVLVAVAIGYALSMVLLTWRTRRRIANTPLPTTPTRIDVFPDAFFVSEGQDENRSYVWSEAAIVDTDQHVFITQGTRKPVIIPVRAFENLQAMQTFVSMAEAWHNAYDIAQESIEESGEVKP